ncbi:MAG: DUF378 domain-containing protein [Clostridium sp.]
MKGLDILALILIIVGALNWGLIGFFGFNLVEAIFGVGMIAAIVYVLVGISGLYSISFFARNRRRA